MIIEIVRRLLEARGVGSLRLPGRRGVIYNKIKTIFTYLESITLTPQKRLKITSYLSFPPKITSDLSTPTL